MLKYFYISGKRYSKTLRKRRIPYLYSCFTIFKYAGALNEEGQKIIVSVRTVQNQVYIAGAMHP